MSITPTRRDQYLPPGTWVRYDGLERSEPELGLVVQCWFEAGIGGYDCYVAFFTPADAQDRPTGPPYILRYAASSLNVLAPPAP